MPVLCPDCPHCGTPPRMAMSPEQAFCPNTGCKAICWDMTRTKEENLATVNLVDITELEKKAQEGP